MPPPRGLAGPAAAVESRARERRPTATGCFYYYFDGDLSELSEPETAASEEDWSGGEGGRKKKRRRKVGAEKGTPGRRRDAAGGGERPRKVGRGEMRVDRAESEAAVAVLGKEGGEEAARGGRFRRERGVRHLAEGKEAPRDRRNQRLGCSGERRGPAGSSVPVLRGCDGAASMSSSSSSSSWSSSLEEHAVQHVGIPPVSPEVGVSEGSVYSVSPFLVFQRC